MNFRVKKEAIKKNCYQKRVFLLIIYLVRTQNFPKFNERDYTVDEYFRKKK